MKKGPPNSGFFFSAAGQMFFRYYLRENSWGVFTYTAANVRDVTEASKPLREDDEVVYGDSAYLGLEKREEIKIAHSFPPSNTGSTAVRAGCPRFPTTPLTGSGTLRTENPLCAARWSTPTEL